MFQPLSKALATKRPIAWDETDARHFIQAWLRERTRTSALHCGSFRKGVTTVRAESPAVRMMVKLLEYDLNRALNEAGGPKVKDVRVTY